MYFLRQIVIAWLPICKNYAGESPSRCNNLLKQLFILISNSMNKMNRSGIIQNYIDKFLSFLEKLQKLGVK